MKVTRVSQKPFRCHITHSIHIIATFALWLEQLDLRYRPYQSIRILKVKYK